MIAAGGFTVTHNGNTPPIDHDLTVHFGRDQAPDFRCRACTPDVTATIDQLRDGNPGALVLRSRYRPPLDTAPANTERVRSAEATQEGNMSADAHRELSAADFPPGHVDVKTRLRAARGELTDAEIRARLVQLSEVVAGAQQLGAWLYDDVVRGVTGRYELRTGLDALKLTATSVDHALTAHDGGQL